MRLLSVDIAKPTLKTFTNDRERPDYAILSHTWLADDDEVLFADLANLTEARQKRGWKKIEYAVLQAREHGLGYVWLDTCCIDRSSSTELAEAINSMFRWYQNSAVCYVYLEDVPDISEALFRDADTQQESEVVAQRMLDPREVESRSAPETLLWYTTRPSAWPELIGAKWFTRGWTLQEMLAPTEVLFFTAGWHVIGNRASLSTLITEATAIPEHLLMRVSPKLDGFSEHLVNLSWPASGIMRTLLADGEIDTTIGLDNFSVAQILSWAARRRTTRIEDRAYSLLGLFNISMPVLYGEGENAFIRLQHEILRKRMDHSIFAWASNRSRTGEHDLLARSPDQFKDSMGVIPCAFDFLNAYEVSNIGIRVQLPVDELEAHYGGQDPLEEGRLVRACLHCRWENDPMSVVALQLSKVHGSSDVYTTFEQGGLPRTTSYDAFDAQQLPRRSVTILFSPTSIGGLALRPQTALSTADTMSYILVRLDKQREGRFRTTGVTSASFERSASLTEDATSGSSSHQDRDLTMSQAEPAAQWNPSSRSFSFHTSRSPEGFSASIKISSAGPDIEAVPIILQVNVKPGRRSTFLPSSQLDHRYRMWFGTEPGSTVGRSFEDLHGGTAYVIGSSKRLTDGSRLEAELSLVNLATMPSDNQEVVVVNVRRYDAA